MLEKLEETEPIQKDPEPTPDLFCGACQKVMERCICERPDTKQPMGADDFKKEFGEKALDKAMAEDITQGLPPEKHIFSKEAQDQAQDHKFTE